MLSEGVKTILGPFAFIINIAILLFAIQPVKTYIMSIPRVQASFLLSIAAPTMAYYLIFMITSIIESLGKCGTVNFGYAQGKATAISIVDLLFNQLPFMRLPKMIMEIFLAGTYIGTWIESIIAIVEYLLVTLITMIIGIPKC